MLVGSFGSRHQPHRGAKNKTCLNSRIKVLAQLQHSAMWQVLLQPELLEIILICLPMGDLLHSQRTCQWFKKTIDASPRLQQALFMQSEPIKSAEAPVEGEQLGAWSSRPNPLLAECFQGWFHEGEVPYSFWTFGDFDRMPWDSSRRSRDAFARAEASWRKMLVAQPATESIEVFKIISSMGGTSVSKGRLMPEDGIRMGSLYDLAWDWVPRRLERGFCFGVRGFPVAMTHEPKTAGSSIAKSPRVLYLHQTVQCCMRLQFPQYMLDQSTWFKSDAYKDQRIEFEEFLGNEGLSWDYDTDTFTDLY